MSKSFNVVKRTLYDIRDNKPYLVRKLADGECWMMENLAYELYAGQTYIGSYNDGSTFAWTPESCSSGGACAMNGATIQGQATNFATGQTGTYWYYNWYAATAGVGQSSSTGDINGSICPAQWKLPYNYVSTVNGVSSSARRQSFGALFAAYGLPTGPNGTNSGNYTPTLDNYPFDFVRVESASGGTVQVSSWQHSLYWSSTSYNATHAYYMYYRTHDMSPQGYGSGKAPGVSIRCVAI